LRKGDVLYEEWNTLSQPGIHDGDDRFICALPETIVMPDKKNMDDEHLSSLYSAAALPHQAFFYHYNLEAEDATLEPATPIALLRYIRTAQEVDLTRLRSVYVESVNYKSLRQITESEWSMIGDTVLRRAFRQHVPNPNEAWFLLTLKDSGYTPEEWMHIPFLEQEKPVTYTWQRKFKVK